MSVIDCVVVWCMCVYVYECGCRCPYGHVYMWDELDEFREESGVSSSVGLCEREGQADREHMQIHCVNTHYNVYSPCVLQCVQMVGDKQGGGYLLHHHHQQHSCSL